ncbi:MAG: SH3 domain-containing protein [Chitinophagaceae bacterium]
MFLRSQVSYANLRLAPSHKGELYTQALYNEKIIILDEVDAT